MNPIELNSQTISLSPNEVLALFAAVNYVEQELNAKRIHTYSTIIDWAKLYPELIEKLDRLRSTKS